MPADSGRAAHLALHLVLASCAFLQKRALEIFSEVALLARYVSYNISPCPDRMRFMQADERYVGFEGFVIGSPEEVAVSGRIFKLQLQVSRAWLHIL